MKWSKISDYCIQSGRYQIAKYTHSGVDSFEVRYAGDLIATEGDPGAAKRVTTWHDKAQRAQRSQTRMVSES